MVSKTLTYLRYQQRVKLLIDNNMRMNTSNTPTRFELATPHFPNIFALSAAIRVSKIGIRRTPVDIVMELEKRNNIIV